MKDHILTVNGLTKKFGKLTAVNNISLQVEGGTVFGILGPNGSGKSTTLGMLLGAIEPFSGSYSWFGQQNHEEARKRIGTLIEGPNFYNYMSGYNNLKVNATIKEVPFSDIERVLKLVNLWDRRNSSFRTYSTGMKQRLGIANALLGDPNVLVLDEPTNGLDPQGIVEVRELIKQQAAEGKTILLASHLLDEVERVCTHMAVLRKGNLLYHGEVQGLNKPQNTIQIAAKDIKELMQHLSQHPSVHQVNQQDKFLIVQAQQDVTAEDLNRFLFERGVVVSHLSVQKKSLESQFIELTSQQ